MRFVILIGLLASANPAPAVDSSKDHVVVLEPFEVSAGLCSCLLRFDRSTDRLKSARLTWTSPRLIAQGLRTGDFILTIDGRDITSLKVDDFWVAWGLPLKTDSRDLALTIKRGKAERAITLKLIRKKTPPVEPSR